MNWASCPAVYEINTWLWLQDLSRQTGRVVTLGNVPDSELKRLAQLGFDAIWLMGVWQRSQAARRLAQDDRNLSKECRVALTDFTLEDVIGSPYAIRDYRVDSVLGGDEELALLRDRLRRSGLRLILDFIPNHFAIDHAWLEDHPERFVRGSRESVDRISRHYFAADNGTLFAHGRDPNLPPWTDTVQLDYRRWDTRQAMTQHLLAVAERCDGMRCDMAMLVTHDVFLYTWGGDFDEPGVEFWPDAIRRVKAAHPDCLMLAEVYWDLEAELQQMGFDLSYDKGLYDAVLDGQTIDVRLRLHKSLKYQRGLVRFIENHDEKRAVEAFGGPLRSRAVATLVLSLPGMRLFHAGQLEGQRLKLPVQLARRLPERADEDLERFYRRLLLALQSHVFHVGQWRLLAPRSVSPNDVSFENIIAYQWVLGEDCRLVVVNLSPDTARCVLQLSMSGLPGRSWRLRDLLGDAEFVREGKELWRRGLDVEMPAYGCSILTIEGGAELVNRQELVENAKTEPDRTHFGFGSADRGPHDRTSISRAGPPPSSTCRVH